MVKRRTRRRAVHSVPFTAPTTASGVPRGFDALVMQGTCVACKQPFKNHFNQDGRFVGCNPNAKADDEFAAAAVFVPPVIIPSAALNQMIQARAGAVIVHPSSAPTSVPTSGTPAPVKFGRPADMFYPLVEQLEPGYGERLRVVFEHLARHRDEGVTLRALVTEIGMPYSTVQAQIKHLIQIKAAERRSPAA